MTNTFGGIGVVLMVVGAIMALSSSLMRLPKMPPTSPLERRAELFKIDTNNPIGNCAFIGYNAGINTTSGRNLVILGHDLEPTESSNQLSIRYSDGTIFRMPLKTTIAYDRP